MEGRSPIPGPLIAVALFSWLLCSAAAADGVASVDSSGPAAAASPAGTADNAQAPADPKALAEQQFEQRLSTLATSDIAGLLDLASWAAKNGLERQANELYWEVVAQDSDNQTARAALRQVKIGSQWYSIGQAVAVLAPQATVAGFDPNSTAIINRLVALMVTSEERAAVGSLGAYVQLCQGGFFPASATFSRLASGSPANSLTRGRLYILADIIAQNGGMYVLTEAYPPQAALLGKADQVVPAGPASLADPRVLAAALHDRARGLMNDAAGQLDRVKANPPGDSQAADEAYAQIMGQFDQADALVPDISHSYRVEVSRLRVEALRRRAEAAAVNFDADMAALGREDLTRRITKPGFPAC